MKGNEVLINQPTQVVPHFEDVATSSADYAARFSGPIGRWLLEVQTGITARNLKYLQEHSAKNTLSILDVCGGHAQIARPFFQTHRITVTGSDEQCRAQIDNLVQSGRCEFEVANPLELPYQDQCFDVVCCYRFLTHCDQWPAVVSELCRVSRYGVLVDYPPLASFNLWYPILFKAKKVIEGNTRPFTLFSHSQVTQEFKKSGFHCVVCEGEFFWPMVLHRALKTPRLSELLEWLPRKFALTKVFGSPVIALFQREA